MKSSTLFVFGCGIFLLSLGTTISWIAIFKNDIIIMVTGFLPLIVGLFVLATSDEMNKEDQQ